MKVKMWKCDFTRGPQIINTVVDCVTHRLSLDSVVRILCIFVVDLSKQNCDLIWFYFLSSVCLSVAQQDLTLMSDPVITPIDTSSNSDSNSNSITYSAYRRRTSPLTVSSTNLSPHLYNNNNNRLHSNHHSLQSHLHSSTLNNNGNNYYNKYATKSFNYSN